MLYLITGGAGFIGRSLTRALLRDSSNRVRVVDNFHRSERVPLPGAAVIEGDIRDRELLTWTTRGVDVVYHLGAQSNVIGAVADLEYSFSTNVLGTYNVLHAARAANVGRVIFTSSREVYGDVESLPVAEDTPLRPKNAYGASKLAGEEYGRVFARAGLPVTILRLANVYGPGDQERVIPVFVRRAIQGDALELYGGEQIIDFISIDRAVTALLRAQKLDAECGPLNIGSGVGTTVRQLAEQIVRRFPSTGISCRAARPEDVGAYVADIRRAVQLGLIEAGRAPLAELERTIEWEARRQPLDSCRCGLAQLKA